jgi:hypothetical protein
MAEASMRPISLNFSSAAHVSSVLALFSITTPRS